MSIDLLLITIFFAVLLFGVLMLVVHKKGEPKSPYICNSCGPRHCDCHRKPE